jgi:hypothetical protein
MKGRWISFYRRYCCTCNITCWAVSLLTLNAIQVPTLAMIAWAMSYTQIAFQNTTRAAPRPA